MADFLIYDKTTKEIVCRYSASAQNTFGGPWKRHENEADAPFAHVEITNGVDLAYAVVDEYDNIVEDLEPAWNNLRAERDKLLAACDFTQVNDAPLTAQEVADYATYRQELRDLPANTVDPKNPSWPVKP